MEVNEEWDRGGPRGCALGSKVTAALLATTEFFHPTILQSTKGELGMERKKKKNCKHLRDRHADGIKDDCLHRLYLIKHHIRCLIKINSIPDPGHSFKNITRLLIC